MCLRTSFHFSSHFMLQYLLLTAAVIVVVVENPYFPDVMPGFGEIIKK